MVGNNYIRYPTYIYIREHVSEVIAELVFKHNSSKAKINWEWQSKLIIDN